MNDPVEVADVNVLVALVVANHEHHETARVWQVAATRFATTPLTETGLLRILMNPAANAGGRPLGIAGALATLRAIKQHKAAEFIPDSTSLTDARSLTGHVTGHKQITDTHLLNLAIAHGGRLVTFDAKIIGSLTARQHRHVRVLGAVPA